MAYWNWTKERGGIRMRKLTAGGLVLLAGFALLMGAATPAAAQEQLTDEERAKANNPIASLSAINLQNFYSPSLWDVPDVSANTFYIRAAFPIWRTLTRASLPFASVPTSSTSSVTGLSPDNS